MAFINKHDTNGTKDLLAKGELGYDDYTIGGDVGRVYVGTGTENIAVAKKSEVVEKDSDTGSASIPAGTTAERTSIPVPGMLRYNTELNRMEMYDLDNWREVGGGQLLGTTDVKAVGYMANSTAENLVVPTGTNAFSIDSVTIEDGGSITVENESTYKIL